ncbi:hypothetical protein ACIQMZ_37220 [Streptomyces longwoodensis]|uniref:hypothetical protein n=1 Tax=Streptomyces longwoodensis TaxID=68231 RepID=UPI00381E96F1
MGDTAPAPGSEQQLTEEAKTEAAEIKDDIKETKAEAAEARADGDTARAERLENRVGALETKLDSVLEKLGKLVDRPFHPAPETTPPPDDQGRTGDGAAEKDAAPETPAGTPAEDKKPRGRRPSRAFFGSRADYDD